MYDPVADIDRLIDAAKVAPSVLNTQPWLFEIVAGDRINLRAQRDRWLRNIDPDGRELAISCGAALFNFRLALRDAGHDHVVWLMPDEKSDPDLLASVEIVTARVHPPTVTTQRLYEAIPWRHTNRQPFEKKVVGVNIVAELEHAAWEERDYLWLLHQRMTRTLLAEIEEANREEKNDDPTSWGYEFQRELEEYTNEPKLREGLGFRPGPSARGRRMADIFVTTTTKQAHRWILVFPTVIWGSNGTGLSGRRRARRCQTDSRSTRGCWCLRRTPTHRPTGSAPGRACSGSC